VNEVVVNKRESRQPRRQTALVRAKSGRVMDVIREMLPSINRPPSVGLKQIHKGLRKAGLPYNPDHITGASRGRETET
jgi:hypothetical protein